MTTAIGCSISCPGRLPATASGTSASPVAHAVIRMGASLSLAPLITRAGPNGTPSSRSRRWKWLTIRIPLRAAMPKTARKPTREPRERIPSPNRTASRPPTRAIGRSRKTSTVNRMLPKTACSSSRMTTSAAAPSRVSLLLAAFSSVDSPSTSAW